MDKQLEILLKNNDSDGIKDFFFEKEMEFYNGDMADIIIRLNTDIPNYDCLVDTIGIANEYLSTELFTDDKAMYCINTYPTDTSNLYFVRKEEFGLDDGYAVVNQLIFTNLENR